MIGWIERKLRDQPGTIPYIDPLHSGRHPFQTFMLVFVVASSVPLVVGRVTAGSMEATMPRWAVLTWGLALLGGACVALIGSFWRGKYDTALLLERMGLDVTGFAAVVYGFVICAVAGWDGLLAAAITFSFGLSSLIRARDIARIFARATDLRSPRVRAEDE